MVTGQITEKEYIAAHILHYRKEQFLVNQIAFIVFIIGSFLFFAVSATLGGSLIGAALGGLLIGMIQRRIIYPPKLRRLYAQVRGRVDVTYSWDDEKLFVTSERGQEVRSWTDFLKAKENNELILLYFNDALYEIIAKRWFSEASDLSAFRAHLTFVK
jgi:hypothetical protein